MGAVFYKELLDIVLGRKFIYLLVLFFFLSMMSFYIGSRDFLKLLEEERVALTIQEENLRNQPGGYELLGILGVKLYRPPSKLGFVTKGLEHKIGRVAAINAYTNIELSDPGPNETSISNLFDYLDLTFIIRILLSLIALLYAQEVISGEKEIGTLRHCLSNPIGRSGWLIAKCGARILVLLTSVLIPVGLGVLAVQLLVPELRFTHEEFFRFVFIILTYILYVFVFFSLGIMISAFSKSPSQSTFLAIITWVMLTLIVPSLGIIIGQRLQPLESQYTYEARKLDVMKQTAEEAERNMAEWMAKNPGRKPDTEWLKQQSEKLISSANHQIIRLDEDRLNQVLAQLQLSLNLARLSSAASLSHASMELANTGFSTIREYISALRMYKTAFSRYIAPKRFDTSSKSLKDISPFTFRWPPLSAAVQAIAFDLALLIIYAGLFFSIGYVRFLTYDVR